MRQPSCWTGPPAATEFPTVVVNRLDTMNVYMVKCGLLWPDWGNKTKKSDSQPESDANLLHSVSNSDTEKMTTVLSKISNHTKTHQHIKEPFYSRKPGRTVP